MKSRTLLDRTQRMAHVAVVAVGIIASITFQIVWAQMKANPSRNVLHLMLNSHDEEEKREWTRQWQKGKRIDLERIGITAALVAGVGASAFSWVAIDQASWKVEAMWYSSLVLALSSISTAGLHIKILLRVSSDLDWEPKLHSLLGKKVEDSDPENPEWEAKSMQAWTWQTPGLMLKLSIFFFLAGLACLLWERAIAVALRWGSGELKIAIMVSVVGGFAFINYILSVITLLGPGYEVM